MVVASCQAYASDSTRPVPNGVGDPRRHDALGADLLVAPDLLRSTTVRRLTVPSFLVSTINAIFDAESRGSLRAASSHVTLMP